MDRGALQLAVPRAVDRWPHHCQAVPPRFRHVHDHGIHAAAIPPRQLARSSVDRYGAVAPVWCENSIRWMLFNIIIVYVSNPIGLRV